MALEDFVVGGGDDADAFHAGLAVGALGDGGPFVEADLGEGGVGDGGFLAPAPDVVGLDVVEVGAAAQLAFLVEGGDAGVGWEVDQDSAVAVGEAAD